MDILEKPEAPIKLFKKNVYDIILLNNPAVYLNII